MGRPDCCVRWAPGQVHPQWQGLGGARQPRGGTHKPRVCVFDPLAPAVPCPFLDWDVLAGKGAVHYHVMTAVSSFRMQVPAGALGVCQRAERSAPGSFSPQRTQGHDVMRPRGRPPVPCACVADCFCCACNLLGCVGPLPCACVGGRCAAELCGAPCYHCRDCTADHLGVGPHVCGVSSGSCVP